MVAVDSSRILWSVSADSLATGLAHKPLLVMLHGYGSNAADLFSLAGIFQETYVVASVEGIYPMGEGSCWFQLSQDPVTGKLVRDNAGIAIAVDAVLGWLTELETALASAGVTLKPVTVLGFSQGGALSAELIRRQPSRFAADVMLASFVIREESSSDQAHDEALRAAELPVFYGIDPADPLISPEHITASHDWLANHCALESRRYPHIGHSISQEMLDDVVSFLARSA